MKLYSDRGNLSPDKVRFNFALSRSRVVVENLFGRLKVRFQCIAKTLDTNLEHTVNIVTTCCILHSFCTITKQLNGYNKQKLTLYKIEILQDVLKL